MSGHWHFCFLVHKILKFRENGSLPWYIWLYLFWSFPLIGNISKCFTFTSTSDIIHGEVLGINKFFAIYEVFPLFVLVTFWVHGLSAKKSFAYWHNLWTCFQCDQYLLNFSKHYYLAIHHHQTHELKDKFPGSINTFLWILPFHFHLTLKLSPWHFSRISKFLFALDYFWWRSKDP